MFTIIWWKKAAERATKTAAQVYLFFASAWYSDNLGADQPRVLDAFDDMPWYNVAQMMAIMAVASLATSIITTNVGDDPKDPGIV